jgi:DNA polymerase-1
VVIVTGDRDILQLVVDDKVLVYMPTKGLSEGMLYGEKEVKDRMGVPPSLIVDLKALMGDASDNYPGVSGIGPKTAIKLLTLYGSLEEIYAHIDEITGDTLKAKLIAGKASGALSKKLAAIRTDAPIEFDAKYARISTLVKEEVRDMLTAFRFPSLIRRIGFEERVKKSDEPVNAASRITTPDVQQQELF